MSKRSIILPVWILFCFSVLPMVSQNTRGSWRCLGPKILPEQTMGLISALWVDTANLNFVLAGSAAGGLWKCENAQSKLPVWKNISDSYDSLCTGVWGIAVRPGTKNNTIYIGTKTATKDLSVPYGVGILRTTDSGKSWSRVGPQKNGVIDCLKMCDANPDAMIATAGKEMYFTNNDWASYKTVKLPSGTTDPDVQVCDIEFAPFSDKKVYICTRSYKEKKAELFVSEDFGDTWNSLTHGIRAERIEAAVIRSKRFSDKLYIAYGNTDVYVQFFDGKKWSENLNQQPVQQTFAGTYWNFEFTVNEKDTNVMYISMTEADKSINGGRTFTKIAAYNNTNTHADVRDFFLARSTKSGSGDILFLGNDGGISQSTEGANELQKWKNVNGYGLSVTQFWGLDVFESDTVFIAGGAQDNGLFWYRDTVWYNNLNACGDGYDAAVLSSGSFLGECNAPTIVQNNLKTGNFWLLPVPDNYGKGYTRPIRNIKGKIYLGHRQLYEYVAKQVEQNDYKVKDKTGTINEYKDSEGGMINSSISAFDICGRTMNSACVGYKDPLWERGDYKAKLWYTQNFKAEKPDWTDLTRFAVCDNAQTFNYSEIYDLAIDDLKDRIYILGRDVFNQTNCKVYFMEYNIDSARWIMTNKTFNLPKAGLNKIIKEKDSDQLYLATDAGVYYTNTNLLAEKKWERFNGAGGNKLPACMVTDLYINYERNTLYCSTYARGIWESPLAGDLQDDFRYSRSVEINETISIDGALMLGKNVKVELREKLFISKGSSLDLKAGAELIVKKDKVFTYGGEKTALEAFLKPGSKGRIVYK